MGLYFDLDETSAILQASIQKVQTLKKFNALSTDDRKLYVELQQAVEFVSKPASRSVAALVISVTIFVVH